MKKQIRKLIIATGIILFSSIFYIPVLGQTATQNIVKREIKIQKGQTYLNLPVNSSDRSLLATISVDGKALDRFTINLATGKPEFWTYFDVTNYQGKTLTIEIENAPQFRPGLAAGRSDSISAPVLTAGRLDMIFADTKFPGQDSLYRERKRPQVHITSARGWNNDANGLIYYNKEYHAFFQHNPYGVQWSNMHWGHVVSNDLIHWKQLNEAIFPIVNKNEKGFGDAAFSGSAVVDPTNTSGFRKNGIDPLIVVYTSVSRGECLQMSYDNGRNFVDYEGNPILKHNGRDPKVFWYAPGKYWVMVVFDEGRNKTLSLNQEVSVPEFSIYNSPDLKKWTYQSGISNFFECPELFELPVEGEPGVSKWVMHDASGRYIVGGFDGKKFTIEQGFTKYENGGGHFYASQTFNNSPDGRRIQLAWGGMANFTGMPFNSLLLFPVELKLRRTLNGYRLSPTPVREISSLYINTQVLKDKVIQPGQNAGISVNGDNPIHLVAEFERGNSPITFNILGYELRYDNIWLFSTLAPDDKNPSAPEGPFSGPPSTTRINYVSGSDIFKIEAIADKDILEFYINDGEVYYVVTLNGVKTNKIEASVSNDPRVRGGKQEYILKKLEVQELNSIWKTENIK